MTTALAIYAAIVATAGVAWQIYTYFHSRRSRVKVEAKFGMLDFLGNLVDAIIIKATNRSDHPVRITLGINLQDGSGRTAQVLRQIEGASLPGEVKPHDSGESYMLLDELNREAPIDVTEPVTAWVTLSTGEHLESKARALSANR